MGCADDKELTALFTGYGYQCAIVDYGDLAHESPEADRQLQINLAATMNWAYDEIRNIQKNARNGTPITKPRFPMIVLRTPKGWTGPKFVDGLPVVNSFRAREYRLHIRTLRRRVAAEHVTPFYHSQNISYGPFTK